MAVRILVKGNPRESRLRALKTPALGSLEGQGSGIIEKNQCSLSYLCVFGSDFGVRKVSGTEAPVALEHQPKAVAA